MARAATERLKVNAPVGQKPALRWLRLDEMFVDLSYQRTLDAPQSQTLIRQIAMFWNWDYCQPLTVAKRPNGALMIVDGQHRHAAAKLRGDIEALPCVVATYANVGDEAATFVALNRIRRPLTALDLFKAALAADDPEAKAVLAAIEDAGLRLASSTNLLTLKAGAISNIGGLLRCHRNRGEPVLRTASICRYTLPWVIRRSDRRASAAHRSEGHHRTARQAGPRKVSERMADDHQARRRRKRRHGSRSV
jgi:hypothetical protein